MVNKFWKRLFNEAVYMEFRECFTTAKYKNDMLLLCETINVFIDAFCNSKIHSHQLGPFNNVEIFTCCVRFISSMESLFKGESHERGYLAFNNRE